MYGYDLTYILLMYGYDLTDCGHCTCRVDETSKPGSGSGVVRYGLTAVYGYLPLRLYTRRRPRQRVGIGRGQIRVWANGACTDIYILPGI